MERNVTVDKQHESKTYSAAVSSYGQWYLECGGMTESKIHITVSADEMASVIRTIDREFHGMKFTFEPVRMKITLNDENRNVITTDGVYIILAVDEEVSGYWQRRARLTDALASAKYWTYIVLPAQGDRQITYRSENLAEPIIGVSMRVITENLEFEGE